MTDDDLRRLWRQAGGELRGPGFEDTVMAVMEEGRLLAFLRSVAIPQGYMAVPIKKLVKIAGLIDPPPVEVDGKTMVFKNPMAAEVLTRLSAEVRELIDSRVPGPAQPGEETTS